MYIYNVKGVDELEDVTFARCTTMENAIKASELAKKNGFVEVKIDKDCIPIDTVCINNNLIYLNECDEALMIRLRPYSFAICGEFEDILDKYNIDIPSEDRNGDEGEAHIYGTEYFELEDRITHILSELTQETIMKTVKINTNDY